MCLYAFSLRVTSTPQAHAKQGFSMHLNKADIICMPGVPVEMKTMFLNEVLPVLKEKFSLKEITYKDLHFLSIPESYIDTVSFQQALPAYI